MSFMFSPYPYEDPNPVNRPKLSERTIESIVTGEVQIAGRVSEAIQHLCKEANRSVVVSIDGYPSADIGGMANLLAQALDAIGLSIRTVDVADGYKRADVIDTMLTAHLPEDREIDPVLLFGKLFKGGFDALFDPKKLDTVKADASKRDTDVTVLYGYGAASELFRADTDMVLYLDITPKQAVLRIKAGKYPNMGDRFPRPFKALMRRCYYFDFELALKLRRELVQSDAIDFYIAADEPGKNQLLDRRAFCDVCNSLVSYPFRCKPVYLEGVWGGHFMKRMRKLPDEMLNCAWVFDMIPLEVSILVEAGTKIIELPFFTFVCKEGNALMGERCVESFGGYFPIRFNYDDSYHAGGNMSIQVHPTDTYIKEQFGEHGRQDESYYVVATGHDAKTFLGFRDDIDTDEFFARVRKSERDRTPIDYQSYINHVDSRPGTQFMIPAGTIHSSGRNQVVLEIGSLTVGSYTFKMYDYLRTDLDGTPRPIHSKHGEKVLRTERTGTWVSENVVQKPRLVESGDGWAEYIIGEHDLLYFSLRRYEFEKRVRGNTAGVFHVLNLVDGECAVVYSANHPEFRYEMGFLDIVIVPAKIGEYVIENLGNQPVCVHKTHLHDEFQQRI